jgi:hypothetical protein
MHVVTSFEAHLRTEEAFDHEEFMRADVEKDVTSWRSRGGW